MPKFIYENLLVYHLHVPFGESVDELFTVAFPFIRGVLVRLGHSFPIRVDVGFVPDQTNTVTHSGVGNARRQRVDVAHVYETVCELLNLGIDSVPKAKPVSVVHVVGKSERDIDIGRRFGGSLRVRTEQESEHDLRPSEIFTHPIEVYSLDTWFGLFGHTHSLEALD